MTDLRAIRDGTSIAHRERRRSKERLRGRNGAENERPPTDDGLDRGPVYSLSRPASATAVGATMDSQQGVSVAARSGLPSLLAPGTVPGTGAGKSKRIVNRAAAKTGKSFWILQLPFFVPAGLQNIS